MKMRSKNKDEEGRGETWEGADDIFVMKKMSSKV